MTTPRGFTLMEVLVALVVAGVVVAAAHAALGAAVDTLAHTRAERHRVLAATAARATLERWLRSAVLFEAPAAVPAGDLVFLSDAAGARGAAVRRVRLWVDRDGARGLMAELATLGPGRSTPAETLVVTPRVAALDVRYLVQVGGRARWVAAWQRDTTVGLAVAPRAVALRLVPDGPDGLPPLLRLPVVVPLELEAW